jgi:glycerol kinase
VEVPVERETTALGAAALAGLAVGVWSSTEDVAKAWRLAARYEPALDEAEAERLLAEWRLAVKRALLPG